MKELPQSSPAFAFSGTKTRTATPIADSRILDMPIPLAIPLGCCRLRGRTGSYELAVWLDTPRHRSPHLQTHLFQVGEAVLPGADGRMRHQDDVAVFVFEQ